MGLVVCRHMRTGDPRAAIRRHPARGLGAAQPATAHHDPGGGGGDPLLDAAAGGRLRAAPEPHVGWSGAVTSLIREPLPPRLVIHAANVLRATEIHAWGRDAATVRWLPLEGGAAQLSVAHFKDGGPTYDGALSWPGDIPWPLLLMLPTDLAAALRRELDSCKGLSVGWEAIGDGTLLALLHLGVADRCQWGPLVPQPARHHTYMATPPGGTPARRGMTSSPPSTTTGSSPTTRGRMSRRRRSAGTTGAASAPAC